MLLRIISFIILVLCTYFLGISHCHNETVSTQLKEIKNAQKTTAVIQAAPHAAKSELLELMRYEKF